MPSLRPRASWLRAFQQVRGCNSLSKRKPAPVVELLIYADLFTGQKNLSLPLECSSHIMTVLQIILENRQQSCEIAFDRSPLDYWLSCGTRARPLYADSVDNIALGTSYPHSGIMFGYH